MSNTHFFTTPRLALTAVFLMCSVGLTACTAQLSEAASASDTASMQTVGEAVHELTGHDMSESVLSTATVNASLEATNEDANGSAAAVLSAR